MQKPKKELGAGSQAGSILRDVFFVCYRNAYDSDGGRHYCSDLVHCVFRVCVCVFLGLGCKELGFRAWLLISFDLCTVSFWQYWADITLPA